MKDGMKKFIKRFLRPVLEVGLAVYLGAVVIAAFAINRIMFHPPKDGYNASWPGYVDLGSNGWTIAAMVLGPQHGKKAVLYCHGNAEDLTTSYDYLKMIADDGITAAVVDYEGYGLSSGKPTEAGCYRNVHRLYDWLMTERGFAPTNIVVLGFSIGTGPAVELAATRPVGGLILEEPYLSAPRIRTRVRLLPQDPFPNIARIGCVTAPKMIIHGTADTIVPFWQGQALFAAAPEPKKFVPVPGAGHLDFIDHLGIENYHALIRTFIETGR